MVISESHTQRGGATPVHDPLMPFQGPEEGGREDKEGDPQLGVLRFGEVNLGAIRQG